MKLKLNLYPAVADMEDRILAVIREALDKKAELVEIAYGEAVDSVKKRILNILNKKEIRRLYHRLEKTDKGWGRVYLHFRPEEPYKG